MKRILPLIAMVLLTAVPVFAQSEEEPQAETPKEIKFNDSNRAGDQFIRIAIGADFPINFPNFGSLFTADRKLSVGGYGYIGYQYFLTDMFAVGGEMGFGFNVSIGSHVFNSIPFTANFTFVPSVNQFEFPVTLGVGFSTHTYAGMTYFPGLVIYPQAGAHYRLNDSWSLGFDMGCLFLPEFNNLYDETASNVNAKFFTTSFVVHYFF